MHRGHGNLYHVGEIFFHQIFYNTKVAGLGEILSSENHVYGTVTLIWVHTFFPVLLLVHVVGHIQPRSTQCHNALLGLFVSSRSSHLFPGRCL